MGRWEAEIGEEEATQPQTYENDGQEQADSDDVAVSAGECANARHLGE